MMMMVMMKKNEKSKRRRRRREGEEEEEERGDDDEEGEEGAEGKDGEEEEEEEEDVLWPGNAIQADAECEAANEDSTLAGWPRRTTLILLAIKPSTRLSTAALVSAHASMGVKGFTGLLLTMTSMKASRVRVFPVPGGPCTHTPSLYSINHTFLGD